MDYKNLNKSSKKGNYHVPQAEQILQLVSESDMFSLLGRFSEYNQVLVAKEG